jgi:uncharacterized protein (TIRG00374 family)
MEATDQPKRGKLKKIVVTVLKIAVAVVLLGWVLSGVHWRDYVKTKDGRELEVLSQPSAGQLLVKPGGWRGGVEQTIAVAECEPAGAAGDDVVRQGFVTILKNVKLLYVALACAGFVLSVLVTAVRWWFLLRLLDIHIRVWQAIRLTFLGQFFNTVVPGTVGGDLVKAYYTTRLTPHAAAALISIFVDRMLGLTELTLLATVMLVIVLAGGLARFEDLKIAVLTVSVVVALITCAFAFLLSGRLRAALRLQKLYSKTKIAHHFAAAGEAARLYRKRLGGLIKAVAITFGGHLIWMGSISLIGMGLDLQTPVYMYFLYVPLIYIIGAVPLTPGGVGLLEALYVKFFAPAAPTRVLAMALMARLIPIFWSLPGLLVAISGPHVSKKQMEAELQEAEKHESASAGTK